MGGYIAATRHASISRGWNILKIRRSIKISFSLFFFFFFSNETFSCGNSEIINVEISAFRDTVSREGDFCEDFSYWGERGGGVCSYFD